MENGNLPHKTIKVNIVGGFIESNEAQRQGWEPLVLNNVFSLTHYKLHFYRTLTGSYL